MLTGSEPENLSMEDDSTSLGVLPQDWLLNTLRTSRFIASLTQWLDKFLLNEYKKRFR